MDEGLKHKYPEVIFYGEVVIKENVKIGKGTRMGEFIIIGANATIGKNCRIQYHTTICKDAKIGNGVFIGPNTSLLNDKYPSTSISQPPTIDDNSVIGGGVTILPNVHIGFGAIVGAGSVVTNNVPAGHVVYGNPAKFRMTREEYDEKQKKQSE